MTEGFQVARLLPVSGIANATEAEMRATSALLSVLTIVRDLSTAVTAPLGASAARRANVEAFIETRFKLGDGTVVRPDGVIQVIYGASTWRALVEVKTGDNALQADQINSYLAVAREQGFSAVVTISNEIGLTGTHPCPGVKVRTNAKVRLAHYSWTEILAFAVRAKVHHGVADPEQAWILGELIRYLEHPASGAMAFDDMGPYWTSVRDGAREGTLHRTGEDVRDMVQRWDQLVRFASLKLGADIGVDVQHVVPRNQDDPKARAGYLTELLVTAGALEGTLRIPGAAGHMHVTADLRARQITIATDIAAPADRGNRARVTWLTRQLGSDTPASLAIEAWPKHARQPLTASLTQAIEDPTALVDPGRRDTLRFGLVMRAEMGHNRKDGGRSPGFAEAVLTLLRTFYRDVLQQITMWSPPAPQAPAVTEPVELKHEPIEDEKELAEAITAARDEVTEQTGAAVPRGSAAGTTPAETALEVPAPNAVGTGLDDDQLVAAPTGALETGAAVNDNADAEEPIQPSPASL